MVLLLDTVEQLAIVSSELAGYTPICSECGIALCWDISPEEYIERRLYWDQWRCEKCNPQVVGSWLADRIERKKRHDNNQMYG